MVAAILASCVQAPIATPEAAAPSAEETALVLALENLPDGQSLEWDAGNGSTRGSITVVRTFQAEDGTYCREYRQSSAAEAAGAPVACRHGPNDWRPM